MTCGECDNCIEGKPCTWAKFLGRVEANRDVLEQRLHGERMKRASRGKWYKKLINKVIPCR